MVFDQSGFQKGSKSINHYNMNTAFPVTFLRGDHQTKTTEEETVTALSTCQGCASEPGRSLNTVFLFACLNDLSGQHMLMAHREKSTSLNTVSSVFSHFSLNSENQIQTTAGFFSVDIKPKSEGEL